MSTKIQAVELDKVVIKFAGDSGDGMQLTGTQFTDTSALLGNDLATFPDLKQSRQVRLLASPLGSKGSSVIAPSQAEHFQLP